MKNEELEKFIHDLCGPLTIVKGFMDEVASDGIENNLTDSQKELFGLAVIAVEKMQLKLKMHEV